MGLASVTDIVTMPELTELPEPPPPSEQDIVNDKKTKIVRTYIGVNRLISFPPKLMFHIEIFNAKIHAKFVPR
jgi:hypothetical protein